jgi:hypothetical protein
MASRCARSFSRRGEESSRWTAAHTPCVRRGAPCVCRGRKSLAIGALRNSPSIARRGKVGMGVRSLAKTWLWRRLYLHTSFDGEPLRALLPWRRGEESSSWVAALLASAAPVWR